MRVALVYDRVNKWGGAERVLLILHEMFPDAPLYTSVYDKKGASWAKVFPEIYTSFLQKIPFAKNNHELLAPLMPLAFERFNFDDYDLVISVTSEAAKGIITKPGTLHVCYCLTPTRYLWSHYKTYFRGRSFQAVTGYYFRGRSFQAVTGYLRKWDKIAAQRPDIMIAISSAVQERTKKYYERDTEVVFPPLTFKSKIRSPKSKTRDFFLVVSRLVKYKKVDLAIEAFNQLNLPLVVVGTGRDEGRLKRMAKRNIGFVGFVPEEKLGSYYSEAKALIFPQEEDFGLAGIEALSCGTPVIAYKAGGALNIVKDSVNGVFFEKQTANSLVDAIHRFDRLKFVTGDIVRTSQKFSKENFKNGLLRAIEDAKKGN